MNARSSRLPVVAGWSPRGSGYPGHARFARSPTVPVCHSGTMISLLLRLIINAVGLWLAVELVDGIDFTDPEGTTDTTGRIIALLVLAVIFTIVNALVKPLVKLLSLPLVILTLGLFLLVVNALMLLLTAWLSQFTDYGLTISGFWAALWGAVIIAIVNFVLGLVVPDRD